MKEYRLHSIVAHDPQYLSAEGLQKYMNVHKVHAKRNFREYGIMPDHTHYYRAKAALAGQQLPVHTRLPEGNLIKHIAALVKTHPHYINPQYR